MHHVIPDFGLPYTREQAYSIPPDSGNHSNVVSFEFGKQVLKNRIESAKLVFFLKT